MLNRLLPALVFICISLLSPLLHAAAGDLDTSFNGTGKVQTGLGGLYEAYSVIQQSDGKLVAAGYSITNGNQDYDFALARYNLNGTLDTTFNGTGVVTTPTAYWDNAYSVIQQSDGKLVVAGDGDRNFTLVRYNSDGSLDTTFNGTGRVNTLMGTGGWAVSVIQQSDGKLVAAGRCYNGGALALALVRYNGDGSLDTTFNGTGKLIDTGAALARSVIQQSNGKLVAAGKAVDSDDGGGVLLRYNSNGTRDGTFSSDGKVTTPYAGDYTGFTSVIQQSDGKLVSVGGWFNSDTSSDFAVHRYNANGSLDVRTTTYSVYESSAASLIQQNDGKLVVAGWGNFYGVGVLVRYNTDFTLDTTFNGTGKILNFSGEARSVIQQNDGKLVVAGFAESAIRREFALTRFYSGQDVDGDGYDDQTDAFPLNPLEWLDTDSDGIGNNADWDDDGDGIPDGIDADPLSAASATEITLPLDATSKGAKLNNTLQRQ